MFYVLLDANEQSFTLNVSLRNFYFQPAELQTFDLTNGGITRRTR